jgi:hypothetical protein
MAQEKRERISSLEMNCDADRDADRDADCGSRMAWASQEVGDAFVSGDVI